ncbi:transmembrane protein 187-like [Gigantopelta aegis]|uniref:transmembrane protein 187-like n=1 Tax=Gigantopelta aegis TaxID=1735272 RepID=UPI001B88A1F4|nr:transmembrane protein 187-like [Gigantopelta aegis]XP_041346683.1 transmembrane protein 187-like [Gigantopelta aegis]
MSLLWKAIATVTLFSAVLSLIVFQGVFESAPVDIGSQHYAEVSTFRHILPVWVRMPFNTIVNIGYIIVGAYWCAMTTLASETKLLGDFDVYMFYLFNVMSGFYGGVQLLRILTQKHEFAVLDQWCTLPFFAMVLIWSLNLTYGWKPLRSVGLILLSLASYVFVLWSPIGFEIALAIHIVGAITGAVVCYRKYPNEDSQFYFVMAMLSCAGFVGLKVFDLELPKYANIFKYISGHFLSKIADILQIHFVDGYFQSLIIERIIISRRNKTVKTE